MAVRLPPRPFHGQEFIDATGIKWVWDATLDTWNRTGQAEFIPVADSNTTGLMSANDKILLDSIPNVGGGFGLITDPLALQSTGNVDGILSGDITIKSDTLNITCVDAEGEPITTQCYQACDTPDGQVPGLKLELSNDFLETFWLELLGGKGPRGTRGPKGKRGSEGFTNGPQGEKGDSGKDATIPKDITNIRIVDSDDVVDEAIVALEMNAADATLTYTTSKLNVPSNTDPADQVIASPLYRAISFPTVSTLHDWELVAPQTDPAGTIDLLIAKLPASYQSGKPLTLEMVKLSDYVQLIVDFYSNILCKWEKDWETKLKEYIESKDEAARNILSSLAQQVAECEFTLPLEFCLGLDNAQCQPPDNTTTSPSPSPSTPTSPGPTEDCKCEDFTFQCNQCLYDGLSPGNESIYTKTLSICSMFTDAAVGAIQFDYDYFSVSSRFVIRGAQGRLIFDSGCAPTGSQGPPPNTNNSLQEKFNLIEADDPITITVNANCNFLVSPFTSAYWFTMTCLGPSEGGPGRIVDIATIATPLADNITTTMFTKDHELTSEDIGRIIYIYQVKKEPDIFDPEPVVFEFSPNGRHTIRSIVDSNTITSVWISPTGDGLGGHSTAAENTGYAVL